MNKKLIIKQTISYVKKTLSNSESSHNWWHIYRVHNLSKIIAQKEQPNDIFIVELGALLHDIADWKFNNGNEQIGSNLARKWLEKLNVDEIVIKQVCHIIENISFKGAGVKNTMKSKEGLIVQDADRLDALGAIGIARAFAYGGYTKKEIYNPDIKPQLHKTFDEYKNSNNSIINHFYEKLLLLKNNMNTKTGKNLAEHRHEFMQDFLDEFYKEWKYTSKIN